MQVPWRFTEVLQNLEDLLGRYKGGEFAHRDGGRGAMHVR